MKNLQYTLNSIIDIIEALCTKSLICLNTFFGLALHYFNVYNPSIITSDCIKIIITLKIYEMDIS